MLPLPIQFLQFILVGWVSRQQQDFIEYLKAENRALREQLGGKRLRFTDAQRRRLARKAKPLGRRTYSTRCSASGVGSIQRKKLHLCGTRARAYRMNALVS